MQWYIKILETQLDQLSQQVVTTSGKGYKENYSRKIKEETCKTNELQNKERR